MDGLFRNSTRFGSLSLRDLLEARALFHAHLLSKRNVVATAVGPYRIRRSDPWPTKANPHGTDAGRVHPPRTLANSEPRPYSWPSVYVFVSDWCAEHELAKDDPSDVVPRALYLPNGTVVPVCVIEARRESYASDLAVSPNLRVARNQLGPGSAIVNSDAQGLPRLATVGALVRDGERYYALTNRHAVGGPGTPIEALNGHRQPRVGVSAAKGLTRVDFHSVYPGLPSRDQYLLMDVGLVDLDDVRQWKCEPPGIAPVGPVVDLYDSSFTLQLVGRKVVGIGAVSGRIRGEIQGLFYRYKALGGFEYVCDFLIGAEGETAGKAGRERQSAFSVHHGDSGTVLYLEHDSDTAAGEAAPTTVYYPLGLLWGREEFYDGGRYGAHPYGLATSLSTALDRLELDFVRDLNRDEEYVWGWVGHYAIGRTLPLVGPVDRSAKLKAFIDKNLDRLALEPDAALSNVVKPLDSGDAAAPAFVPLADVPDNVWKSNVNFAQARGADGTPHRTPGPGSRGQNDNPNHFADLDLPYQGSATFLEYNLANLDTSPAVAEWLDYFDSVKDRYAAWAAALERNVPVKSHWGALPFRVWQLFDAMQLAASRGDQPGFLCAGGVLIHYVGDACQPLHTSYLSQGDPDRVVKRPQAGGNKLEADGVHGGYEDDMVNFGYQQNDLAGLIAREIRRQDRAAAEDLRTVGTGHDAARATLRLIGATHATIAPREIVDEWVALKARPRRERTQAMWDSFGTRTATCMARGARYLGHLWEAAWVAGDGDRTIGAGAPVAEKVLMKLYNDPAVLPSVPLDRYPGILSAASGQRPMGPGERPPGPGGPSGPRRRSRSRTSRSG
jgi:hypothetical protein